jgi:hypothetical protein
MTGLRFQILEIKDSTPQEWLRLWADRYNWADDQEHRELIARHVSLTADDFERIGKWKDGLTTEAAVKGSPQGPDAHQCSIFRALEQPASALSR